MDTDQVCDVPDTPDRLAEHNINGRHFMGKESDSSVASHSGKTDFSNEGARNWLRGRSKLVIDNGTSRRPSFHHVKKPCTSNKSKRDCDFTISSGNAPSSKNVHLCRTMEVDNTVNGRNSNSSRCQLKEGKGKALWTSTYRGNNVVDLTEQNGSMLQKTFPNRASEHCHAEEIRKRPIAANGFSSSVASHSGKTDFSNEGARNWLRGRSKLVIDNGTSRRPSFHHVKKPCTSNKSKRDCDFTISSGNAPSSKNVHLCRTMKVDNTVNGRNSNSSHCQPKEGKGKALWTSTYRGNNVVDLTEQNGSMLQKTFPNRASEHCHAEEIRKRPIAANGFSPLHGMANSSSMQQNAFKGKEKVDDTCKGGSGADRGKGIFVDSVPNVGKSLVSIPSPIVRGPKRLVRYGFISPHSTEKAKKLAENHSNGSSDVQSDKGASNSDFSSSLIRELIAEDTNSQRRKPFSSKESGTETMNFPTRHSLTSNEEVSGTSNANGWRRTSNHTKQVNPTLSDHGQLLSQTKNDPHSVNQENKNGAVRRDNGSRSRNMLGDIYHVGNGNGHSAAASTSIKRQKQSSASSNRCETSTSEDSEIVCHGSSLEPLNSRSINNRNSLGIFNPIIENEAYFFSERRHISHHRGHNSSNSDSNGRERQLEADETLARELQEQLYNESPGGGNGEIDAHIALALQQEETFQPDPFGGNHRFFHSRGPVISNFNRQPHTRSSQYPPNRRGTQVRGRSSARLTRLRSRFPSQSTRVSNRERRSTFPSDMDLDMQQYDGCWAVRIDSIVEDYEFGIEVLQHCSLPVASCILSSRCLECGIIESSERMHILEALEAFSDMGVTGNFIQAEHDFNENDYESLLGLEENNHQHGGASLDQINMLPQSTVQGNHFDETCAICLDTPTTGDTIRHLRCLHKFHKDCIDPWLRRRTSCPVCKCSIT